MTTVVRNGPSAEPVLQLLYYDGDPVRGGRLFDWELIPYLGASAQHVNRVTYTPPICGERTIYVTARFGKGEITTSTPIDNPPCRIVFPFVRKD